MARPLKEGLDYFPLDVDFFDDDKILLIESEFGIKGSIIALRLLCKIYKEKGYYYQWGADECLLFTRSLGVEGVTNKLVDEVINGLIRRCFFDKRCFDEFKILTSKGIQERYVSIVKTSKIKRKKILENYDLLEVSEETSQSSEELTKSSEESTQRKGKERKINQTKGNILLSEGNKEEESFFDLISPPDDGANRNWDGFKSHMKKYNCSEYDFKRLVAISNYAEIGHPIWELISEVRNSNGKINQPVRFIISKLLK